MNSLTREPVNASQNDGRKIYSVSELNREIKVVLEDTYRDIWLEGEISNYKTYASGHQYFSLKDEDAQLSAVLFLGMARSVKFALEDGQKVLVRGHVSTYTKRGTYQLIVEYVEPAGKGALQLAFEQLKKKLDSEGLFDPERKKTIPALPQKVGIVTSPDGAAIRDILSVIRRRFANIEILLYPVRVQGNEAKFEITEALRYLNEHHSDLDVLLVGRGGGSLEDLWAFNEEIVVRAIADSSIPIISCIGHEIDFTISDFVSDLRAPTPSAAAELLVKSKEELINTIYSMQKRLEIIMASIVASYSEKLKSFASSRALRHPADIVEERIQELDQNYSLLRRNLRHRLELYKESWRLWSEKLNLVSPLTILDRGYAFCIKLPENSVVKNAKVLKANDRVSVRVAKGSFNARVEGLEE